MCRRQPALGTSTVEVLPVLQPAAVSSEGFARLAEVESMAEPGLRGVSWEQVLAFRLSRQHLTRRAGRNAILEVAADVCGLHAQVMSSAELTLWARMDGLRPEDVAHLLWDRRSLVKMWAMRGTLHIIPAPDVPVWQAALSSFRHYLAPGWLKNFGVSAVELD